MRAGENIPNLCWEISVWTEEPERMVLSLDLGDCDTEEAEVEEAPMVLRDLFCLKYHQPKIEWLKYTVT